MECDDPDLQELGTELLGTKRQPVERIPTTILTPAEETGVVTELFYSTAIHRPRRTAPSDIVYSVCQYGQGKMIEEKIVVTHPTFADVVAKLFNSRAQNHRYAWTCSENGCTHGTLLDQEVLLVIPYCGSIHFLQIRCRLCQDYVKAGMSATRKKSARSVATC